MTIKWRLVWTSLAEGSWANKSHSSFVEAGLWFSGTRFQVKGEQKVRTIWIQVDRKYGTFARQLKIGTPAQDNKAKKKI